MRKILIINIFGIGDVLFTYPLIDNIKAFDPKCEIGYIGNQRTAALLRAHPDIDKVFIYEKDTYKHLYRQAPLKAFKYLLDLYKNIRKERYDAVIDLSLNYYFSFLCWKAGIPQRVGLNFKQRSRFLNNKVELKGYEGRHVVDYYLELLTYLDIPVRKRHIELRLRPQDREWAERFFRQKDLLHSPLRIGMAPGGGDSWGKDALWKQWPMERYAKLADKLFEKFSADIILLGGKNDEKLCEKVKNLIPHKVHSACGRSTILQFAALANQCDMVVLNDGGPLHVAVAAGAKTVSIFGPVDEDVYGPRSSTKQCVVTSDVFCRPCYRQFKRARCQHAKCLQDISVEHVFQKIEACL
jgi:lipopolysaccharide heptosyltransferase II